MARLQHDPQTHDKYVHSGIGRRELLRAGVLLLLLVAGLASCAYPTAYDISPDSANGRPATSDRSSAGVITGLAGNSASFWAINLNAGHGIPHRQKVVRIVGARLRGLRRAPPPSPSIPTTHST